MSGLRRLSDAVLSGAAAGATAGQAPLLNSSTGRFSPGTPKYNLQNNIYNANGADLQKFRAQLAKAAAGTGVCRAGFLGDSTTSGVGATRGTSDYPTQLRSLIAARGYALAGSGPILATPVSSTDSRVVLGAGWASFGGTLINSNTNGAVATWSLDQTGEIVDIVYYNTGGGTFSYNIDGAGAVAVTPNTSSTFSTVTVSGLSNTNHTVVITQTNSSTSYVSSVTSRRASGILIGNYGQGSSAVGSWLPPANGGTAYGYFAALAAFVPDHTFVELIINDTTATTSISTYTTQTQQIITALVTLGSGVTLLVSPPTSQGATILPYRTALYALADSNNIGLVDLYDRWNGNYNPGLNTLGLMTDGLHMNAPGYQDKARAVFNAFGL